VAYIAYCLISAGYAVFVVVAAVASNGYRDRVHRGSWLHVGEGWALVAALLAAVAWARHEIGTSDVDYTSVAPQGALPGPLIGYWMLVPPAIASLIVMAITTIVRSIPRTDKR